MTTFLPNLAIEPCQSSTTEFGTLCSPTTFFNSFDPSFYSQQSQSQSQTKARDFTYNSEEDSSNSSSHSSPDASFSHSDRESSPASSYLGTPPPFSHNSTSPILANSNINSLVAQQHPYEYAPAIPQGQKQQQQQFGTAECLTPYESYNVTSVDLNAQQHYQAALQQQASVVAQAQAQAQAQQQYGLSIPQIAHQIPQLGQSQAQVQAPVQAQQQFNASFPMMPMSMPMQMGMPMPIYSFPAPSFETPQGTYYFVPNNNNGTRASGIPGAVSWDGEDKGVGRKGKKNGKNQTKRFICPHPDCGRGFARNFNMQSHLKSHLGIREFDCDHCPKKFSRRHDRARHCAAVHDVVHAEANTPEHNDNEDDDDESG